jgi:hypothetical protein
VWWLSVVAASHAQSVEITVTDPLVTSIVLTCADGRYELPVRNGVAGMEKTPSQCQVSMYRTSGVVNQPGKWTCTLDRCSQTEVDHRPVTDGPGRINVILTTPQPPGASLEITCASGYRTRTEISLNTAVFEGIPAEQCTMFFKGTVPAKFGPITAGTWSCGLSNTVAVCTKR